MVTVTNDTFSNESETFDLSISEEMSLANDYLCLGRTFLNDSMQSKLKCFYLNTTLRPYLRLTRIKVEELYKRPQIVLIRNFLSPNETEALKNYSSPLMRRMEVVDEQDQSFVTDQRIAEGHFLYEDQTNLVVSLARRISAITGNYQIY